MFVFDLQRFTEKQLGTVTDSYTNSCGLEFEIYRVYTDNDGVISRSTYYARTDGYVDNNRVLYGSSEILSYTQSSTQNVTVGSSNVDTMRSLSSNVESYLTTNLYDAVEAMAEDEEDHYNEVTDYLDNILTLTVPENISEQHTAANNSSVVFQIEIRYSQGATVNVVNIDAYLDGVKSDLSTSVTARTTAEEGNAEVSRVAANIVSSIKTSCDAAFPANYSSTYTKNSFSFNISLTYAKTAGQATYTIAKAYDAHIYNTDTYTCILNQVSSNTATSLNSLKNFLDTNSPADTESVYTVGGFNWYIGTIYSKSAGNDTVTIRSKLDRSDYGIDTATFNHNVSTKAVVLMTTLTTALDRFPTNTDEIYTIRYMNWYISKRYSKSAGNNTITTWVVLDTHQYNDAHTETFSISAYQTVEDYNNQLVSLIKRLIVAFAPISGVHYTQSDPHYPAGVMTHVIDIDYYKEAGSEDMVVKFTMDNRTIRGYSDPIPVDVNTFTSADITNATNEVLAAALSQSNNTGFVANVQTLANLLSIQSITA